MTLLEETIRQIEALKPDSLTVHALAVKRASRLKMEANGAVIPGPGQIDSEEMMRIASEGAGRMGIVPYYLYRQGYMSGQLENVGCAREGAEGMYNIQIMGERQTILGIGGAATSKIVSPTQKYLKTSFHPKEITVYLDKIDDYIEKRNRLLHEVYGGQED